jgi:hypothetical protein
VPVASVVPLLVSVVPEPSVIVPVLLPVELVSPLDPKLCVVPVSLVPLEVTEQFSRSSR